MRLSARSLVVVAALSFAASTAHASSVDIDFGVGGPGGGSYSPPVDNISTEPIPFSTYTEYGFTATNAVDTSTAADWFYNPNQGNPPPGVVAGTPVYYTPPNPPGGPTVYSAASDELTIKDGGVGFLFDSLDVGTRTGGVTFLIVGLGGPTGTTVEFSATGVDNNYCKINCGGQATYTTYSPTGLVTMNGDTGSPLAVDLTAGSFSNTITSLDITESASTGSVFYLDNVQLTPSPEPSSLFLLGTGLIGLGAIARRRFAL